MLADGNSLQPGVLELIRKLAKENTSLREELASAMRKTITTESVKQNDKTFSVCSGHGLPNCDSFEVLCDPWDQKQKHPGRDGGEESQGKAALLQKEIRKLKQLLYPYMFEAQCRGTIFCSSLPPD